MAAIASSDTPPTACEVELYSQIQRPAIAIAAALAAASDHE
jgi:hypothetical protein